MCACIHIYISLSLSIYIYVYTSFYPREDERQSYTMEGRRYPLSFADAQTKRSSF